jgi:hypothetical protein
MQEPIDLEARFSAIDFRGSVSASGGNSEEAGSRVPGTRDKVSGCVHHYSILTSCEGRC